MSKLPWLVILIIPSVLFAQESDAKKAEAALVEREKDAKTSAEQVKLADDWISAARKFPKDRKRFEERATELYALAWTGDIAQIEKVKLRERLHKMVGFPEDYEKVKGPGAAAPWGIGDAVGAYVDDKFAYAGRRSGKMGPAKDKTAANSLLVTVKFRVLAGRDYDFSAYVFSEKSDVPAELAVRFYDDSKFLSSIGLTTDGDLPVWKKYTAKGKSPDGTMWADVCFWAKMKTGAFWIDEASVVCDGKNVLKNGGFEDR